MSLHATCLSVALFLFALPAFSTIGCAAPVDDAGAEGEAIGAASDALTKTPPPAPEWHKGDPVPPSPHILTCPACVVEGVVQNEALVVSLPYNWQTGATVHAEVYERGETNSASTMGSRISTPRNSLAAVSFTAPPHRTVRPNAPATDKFAARKVTLPGLPPDLAALPIGTKVELFSIEFCIGEGCPVLM
jgi:hypothetical protein